MPETKGALLTFSHVREARVAKRKYSILLIAALMAAIGVYFAVSRSRIPFVRMIQGAFGAGGNPAANVLTGNSDNSRSNAYLNETTLTPANVQPGSFGRLFSLAVDGQIYAQPLYVQSVTMADGPHNVVFTATMHNTVYAFDADTPGIPLWSVNLGPSVPTSNYDDDTGDVYGDILPENGILGTPVIDSSTGTLYVVAATLENSNYFYRLHALDITSGAERFGAPVAITAQVTGTGDNSTNGMVAFDPSQHLQRPGLLLLNGNVYIAFGSHGDSTPFHGWIMGYSAQNVQTQVSVFTPTPNGSGGSFWQSGRGLTADSNGNIYGAASNGDTDLTSNFGDTVLRLDPTATRIADWFAPYNAQDLDANDEDLGTTGALLIDGTNYMVVSGKQGVIYLLDRTSLGHMAAGDSQVVQRLDTQSSLIFNMALWNRPDGPLLYTHTVNAPVTAYKLQGASLGSAPVASSQNGFGIPYQGMALSANGVQSGTGVLWVIAPSGSETSPGILHAYNAEGLAEIWNSVMSDADAFGGFSKFANPTVANGKVYVPGNSSQLVVYGLTVNGNNAIPQVTGIVNAASMASGPLAPGEIVTILGQNLGPVNAVAGGPDANGNFSPRLGGTQVTFNGVPGPLLSTSSGAVTAIVPYEVSSSGPISVVASYQGQSAPAQTMRAADTSPGLFSADGSGSGPGAIANPDGTSNSPSQPAAAGSVVVLSGTGGGQTSTPSTTGATATGPSPLVANVSVQVGGQAAQVVYAGAAPGQVNGAVQINVQLPAGLTGTVPVVVMVGRRSSQATVTVSVQ